jgi:nucleoside-diphosphate-sugar epimerase
MTARLWSCPPALLRQMASVVGRGEEIRRLIDSLYLDSTPAREELGWAPRTPFAHGLQAALA